ncbi:Dynactin subunit 2 [Strongyloides ratti]|uniref:Dynactin subunit 2 n=1 Tax=Strongyloides ratti TaxID=34506 RepID=A0A090LJD6_STRRB|nr:Dynactin subunit 2 [Strongyloides ratti]CEF68218.1 Dynactin subunit 2 [Strongyloides ratti]
MEYNANEQVWESEGTTRPESPFKEETFDSDDIVKVHVDLEEAKKRFHGRILNADHVNFADPFSKARNRGYGSGSYVLEVVGSDLISSGETIDQKFTRLYYEIVELRDQVEDAKAKDTEEYKNSINKDKIILLSEMIKNVTLIKKTNDENKLTNGDMVDEEKESNEKSSNGISQEMYIAQLENRITELEKKIGVNTSANDSVTLLEKLESLKVLIESLNVNHYGAIEKKWRDMKAAVSANAEKIFGDPNNEAANIEKINTLHELTGRWDATCQLLPSVVKRLQSLAALHEEAETFSEKLASLDDMKKSVLNELKVEKESLEVFQNKFATMVSDLMKKLDKIEAKS